MSSKNSSGLGVYNFWSKEETGTLKKHWEFSKKSGIILSIVDRKGMILLILYTGIINYQRLKSYYNILPESFRMFFFTLKYFVNSNTF